MPALEATDYLDEVNEALESGWSPGQSGPGPWPALESSHGRVVYRLAIQLLTRLEFDEETAYNHWVAFQNHWRSLNQTLGREVGPSVAALDYFGNMQDKLAKPVVVENEYLRKKEDSALRDELTGLFNRRFYQNLMARQEALAQRTGEPFSLLLVDVDRFKAYNDAFGHLAGDVALRQLAQVMLKATRSVDYVIRFGGEEFVVVLPDTDRGDAAMVAERLRASVYEHEFPGENLRGSPSVTVSVGLASYPEDALDHLNLLQKADDALYLAKGRGRNQVAAAGSERRRHQRVPFEAPVELLAGPDSRRPYKGEVLDISQSGLRLTSEVVFQQGSHVVLKLFLPDHPQPLVVSGKVVRHIDHPQPLGAQEMGVALEEAETAGSWREFISHHTRPPNLALQGSLDLSPPSQAKDAAEESN